MNINYFNVLYFFLQDNKTLRLNETHLVEVNVNVKMGFVQLCIHVCWDDMKNAILKFEEHDRCLRAESNSILLIESLGRLSS